MTEIRITGDNLQYEIIEPAPSLPSLTPSDPITVTRDGQVLEGLDIHADGTTGVLVNGFKDVALRNSRIRYKNAFGVDADTAHGFVLEDTEIIRVDPPAGSLPLGDTSVRIKRSDDIGVRRLLTENGSNGLFLWTCARPVVQSHQNRNCRNIGNEGQGLKARFVTDLSYTDFYHFQNREEVPGQDNISILKCARGLIARGLIDGNNGPSSAGIQIEQCPEGGFEVVDVDAIHMGTAAFSVYSGTNNVTWTRCRARDNSLRDWGYGYPRTSGADRSDDGLPLWSPLVWVAGGGPHEKIKLNDCKYFNCAPEDGPTGPLKLNLIYNKEWFDAIDLKENDFTPRDPYIFVPTWSV